MSTKAAPNTAAYPLPFEDPLRLLSKSLTKLHSIWMSLAYPFTSVGRDLSVHYTCTLPRSAAHTIVLGNSVTIMKDAVLDVPATAEQIEKPIIVIDDNAQIGYRCFLSATKGIHIERDVIMAQLVLIQDHGYVRDGSTPSTCGYRETAGGRIRIGQGSWIGQGAAIICTHGELVLGRNCVVGANAFVTHSFPPYSVIFGNPARVIKQFDPVRNAWVLGCAHTDTSHTGEEDTGT